MDDPQNPQVQDATSNPSSDVTSNNQSPAAEMASAAVENAVSGGTGAAVSEPQQQSQVGVGTGGAGGASQVQPQQQAQPGVLDLIRQVMPNATFRDERELAQAFVQSQAILQQRNQMAEMAQQMLPQWQEFQRYQAQQQQQAQAQQQQGWWNPPVKHNPNWAAMIERDPATGQLRTKEGVSPTVLQEFLQFKQYADDFNTRLYTDPQGALQPMLEQYANQIVEKHVQPLYQKIQADLLSREIIARNQDILYTKDSFGNLVPSPYAGLYAQTVQHLAQSGISDVREQDRLARESIELNLLRQRFATQSQQQNVNQQVVAQNRQIPNVTAVAGNHNGTANAAATANMSLREQLARAFQANGLTDNDFNHPLDGN